MNNQQYITWTCSRCKKINKWEMHEDGACFVSMVCDYCGDEIEHCLCNLNAPVMDKFKQWGSQGGKKTGSSKVRGDSEYYRNIAKKRKKEA